MAFPNPCLWCLIQVEDEGRERNTTEEKRGGRRRKEQEKEEEVEEEKKQEEEEHKTERRTRVRHGDEDKARVGARAGTGGG